jgi:surface protein
VTSLFELFRGCSNLTKVDTTGWDTSNVTNMKNTFYSCAKLEADLSNLDTSQVTDMNGIFSYANTDAVQGVEDLDVSKVKDFGFAFYGAKSTKLDLSKWDMSSATSLYVMFTICSQLKSLKVNTWNTSNVTGMNSTFWYTDGLKKLDVSGWTSDKCTNMSDLFGHMWALEELDLGNFKIIDNVNSNGKFFLEDVNLKIIHTSNLETIIKLPELLPDRTGKNKGEIRTDIPKGELAQEILAAYSAKNWKIVNGTLVAKYTFDNTVNENLIPVFDTSFTDYVIEDEYLDTENENIITRYIYSIAHEDFSSCKFTNKTGLLSVDYLKITNKFYSIYYH